MQLMPSLKEIEWIDVGTHEGATVASCIPPQFAAYVRILHPMYEDPTVKDRELTWDEEEKLHRPPPTTDLQAILQRTTLTYGAHDPDSDLQRVSWAMLAKRYGLQYTPTIHVSSFTRCLAGDSWPRYLSGPAEGYLPDAERDALADILDRELKGADCYFHFWSLATTEIKSDLLYRGPLREVALFPNGIEAVRLTPTHWFPPDRSWLVYSDYDATHTLVGGPERLITSILEVDRLESLRVGPDTPVGYKADAANLPPAGSA